MARNFMCTKTDPVVETKAGKLRGFQLDGTYVFHGVKYADAKRFHQPTPVEPWEGIKNALAYGYVCPMLQQDQPSNELMVPHRYWPLDENCQYLNIWTQHLAFFAKTTCLIKQAIQRNQVQVMTASRRFNLNGEGIPPLFTHISA